MRLCGVGALFAGFVVLVGCGGGGQTLNTPAGSGGSDEGGGGAGNQPKTTPFVFVSNSGSDTISGFAIDPSTGALTPVPGSPFLTPTPTGLARDGSGKYLTVANGLVTSGFPAISVVIGVDPQTGALFDLHCIDREAPGNHPCYPLITGTRGTPQFVAVQQETLYVGNVRSNDVSVYVQDPPNGDLGTSIPSEFAAGVSGLKFLETSQSIASQRSLPLLDGHDKRGAINSPASRNGCISQIEGRARNQVWAGRDRIKTEGFLFQLDLSIGRAFYVTETMNFQLRADSFNVLNHPNFRDPSGSLSSGGLFGISTAMANAAFSGITNGLTPLFHVGGPRSLQLSLRINF